MLPRPVVYTSLISSGGVTITASEGKSGPLMWVMMSSRDAVGRSSRWMQALITSFMLCGGMSVAMPTAMPVPPFNSSMGTRAGSSTGSSMEPSKLATKSTVPCRVSASSSAAYFDRRDSV